MPNFGPIVEAPRPLRHLFGAVVSLSLAAFFAWAFYIRYWEWRDCIAQALSSCAEPEAGNPTTAGVFWAVPAVLFALLGVRFVYLWRRRRTP